MDDVERQMVSVRADTAGFARDVAAMRQALEGGLGEAGVRAGRLVEGALLRAVRTGKLGFDDLKASALAVLNGIAAASVRGAVREEGGLGTVLGGLLSGLPGRATGGPVAPGRPYLVGERGAEVFVPTSAGRVEAGALGPREVRVAITVAASGGEAAGVLARSSRQVARAVRAALEE